MNLLIIKAALISFYIKMLKERGVAQRDETTEKCFSF